MTADLGGASLAASDALRLTSGPVLNNIGLLADALGIIETVEAVKYAQATGDTTGVYNAFYNNATPFMPFDHSNRDALATFADFVNVLPNGCNQ